MDITSDQKCYENYNYGLFRKFTAKVKKVKKEVKRIIYAPIE